MTWESFYLGCFIVGLFLTVVSVVLGGHFHLPVHVHFPHGWHLPNVSLHHGGHGDAISPLNLSTMLMFLTWFGGSGYLLTRYHSAAATIAFLAALIVGFIGGALMYLW